MLVAGMAVSDRDRDLMRRIGEYKAASHAEAQRAHLALPLAERLRRSWALYERYRSTLPQGDDRDQDPTPFYDRARALGLYRS